VPRVTPSRQILLALVLGIALGLFFGEKLAFLSLFGTAFVQLLQITVLPYVAGSLIYGFGSLSAREARLVFSRGGGLLVLLWALTLGFVFLSPLALPAGKGGSFFSAAPQETERSIDWVGLYIPSNPFHSLANNVVPAVVVFAVLCGIALMGMKDKEALLQPLAVFNGAMGRVGAMVTKTTPFGIFAISAHAAGTLRPDELQRLESFLFVYAGLAILLTFWLLPGLVAALTHVRHKKLITSSQDALVTAFVTSNLFVVLPQIIENARALLADGQPEDPTENELVDVLVPTSFNFPHSAKLLSLSFVPFVSWYAGMRLDLWSYPTIAGAGLLACFGSLNTAIPFLLDLARLPADMFQLFVVSSVLNGRLGSMAAAMHTLTIAILGTCLITGKVRFERARLLRYFATSALVCIAFLAGARILLAKLLPNPATRGEMLAQIRPRGPFAESEVLETLPAPDPRPATGTRLDAIRRSGRIRIGFSPDSIPWAFLNGEGTPVGYDAEQAHQLALSLGVRLEHVKLQREAFADALATGSIDVVMSGVRVSPRATELVSFSRPYAEESVAFLVEDHRREEFADVETIRTRRLRIAIIQRPEWMEAVKRALPLAEVIPIQSPTDFIEQRVKADALLESWERACAWSLLYPELSPALPQPPVGHFSLAYAAPRGEPDLLNMLDTFIDTQRAAGRLESARRQWILGEATRVHGSRWSIARDVLGWWRER
jgi:Na+/H+-dicarboxylate symporter/ABC-type amino acid transport substrate-binding protein